MLLQGNVGADFSPVTRQSNLTKRDGTMPSLRRCVASLACSRRTHLILKPSCVCSASTMATACRLLRAACNVATSVAASQMRQWVATLDGLQRGLCNESHAGTSAQFWHKDPPKNHLRLDGYEVMAALFQQQVPPDGSSRAAVREV
jgi:hypothetical protein